MRQGFSPVSMFLEGVETPADDCCLDNPRAVPKGWLRQSPWQFSVFQQPARFEYASALIQ